MKDHNDPPQGPSSRNSRLRDILQTLALYAGARGRLLQIEAHEAGTRLAGVVVAFLLMAGAFAGAWLLVAPALIWWLSQHYQWPWHYVALGAAGIHLMAGTACALAVRVKLAQLRLFEESLRQFEHDRSWLAGTKHPTQRP